MTHSMLTIRSLLFGFLCLSLSAGCDRMPVSTSAEQGQTQQNRSEQQLSRIAETGTDTTRSATLLAPVFPIVMRAIKDLTFHGFEKNHLNRVQVRFFNDFACYHTFGKHTPFRNDVIDIGLTVQLAVLDEQLSILLSPNANDTDKQQAKDDIASLLSTSQSFKPALLDDEKLIRRALDNVKQPRKLLGFSNTALLNGTFDLGALVFMDFDNVDMAHDPNDAFAFLFHSDDDDMIAICAAHIVNFTVQPIGGWTNEAGVGGNKSGRVFFMSRLLAASIASSEFVIPIVAELNSKRTMNHAQYAAETQRLFRAVATDLATTFIEEFDASRAYSANFSGHQADIVHFNTEDGYDFQGGPHGSFLTYLGMPWYGKGYLQGKIYNLEVAYTQGASLTRQRTRTTSGATETGGSVRSGTAVP